MFIKPISYNCLVARWYCGVVLKKWKQYFKLGFKCHVSNKIIRAPVSELFDVVEQTAAALLPAAGLLPQQAGGVYEVAEHDGRRDVPEQTEDHELHAQSERALLLAYRPKQHSTLDWLIFYFYCWNRW